MAQFPKAKHFHGCVLEVGGFALTKKFSGQFFTAHSQQRSYSREQSRAVKHPDFLQLSRRTGQHCRRGQAGIIKIGMSCMGKSFGFGVFECFLTEILIKNQAKPIWWTTLHWSIKLSPVNSKVLKCQFSHCSSLWNPRIPGWLDLERTLNTISVQAPATGSSTSRKMRNSLLFTRKCLNEPFLGTQITSSFKIIPNPFSPNQSFRWVTVTKFQHLTHSLAYATIEQTSVATQHSTLHRGSYNCVQWSRNPDLPGQNKAIPNRNTGSGIMH